MIQNRKGQGLNVTTQTQARLKWCCSGDQNFNYTAFRDLYSYRLPTDTATRAGTEALKP